MKNVELIEWSRHRATRGFTRCSPASRHTRLRPLVLPPRLAPHAASPACSPASPRATRGFAACSLTPRHTRLRPLVLSPLCSPACNCRTPPSVISRGYYGRLQNVAASQGDTVNPPQPPFFHYDLWSPGLSPTDRSWSFPCIRGKFLHPTTIFFFALLMPVSLVLVPGGLSLPPELFTPAGFHSRMLSLPARRGCNDAYRLIRSIRTHASAARLCPIACAHDLPSHVHMI